MMALPNKPSSSPSPPTATNHQSLQQRRLTRQTRLRYLSDHDAHISSFPPSPLHSLMSSASDHWPSPAAAAVPLPLPRPDSPLTLRHESTSSTPGGHAHHLGQHHPPLALGIRKLLDHDVRNLRSSSNLGRSSFDPATAKARSNLRVNIPSARVLAGNSSCNDPQEHSHDNNDCETISNLKLHFAAKSAPTSIFSSPVTSPRRSSNVDAFDSINFPQDFNDILKVSHTKALHSRDPSPLRSPGSHGPYLNPNIQEGSQQHKLCSRVWPDVDAHPLPRPPKTSSPAHSSTQHQSSIIYHSPETQHQPSIIYHTPESSPSMKGQWQKGKLIGRGSFGSVYHATNLETGASCAMKEVDLIPDDPKSADCMKQLEQEIRILHQLRHPNIVQYYGSEIVGDHFCIYMEYVHPGSIHKFIHEHCGAMTESVVRNFTRHILSGLAYLHGTKTIHRDIKGANLLVDASGIVKLADFGVAKILTETSYELSLKGSPYWMAPELMKAAIKRESNPAIAMAIDIWSLGCTIIEMLTGKPPWSEFEGPQAMFKVLHKSPTIPETLSSEGQDFLQQCFRRNPADRPSAATLLSHAFVHNLHDQDLLIHSQGCVRGGPGQKDNSHRCSPRHSSKSSPSPRHSSKSSPSPRHNSKSSPSPRHSSRNSPKHLSKNSRDVVPASIGRIFNKIQNLIGDTSKKYDTEESNHNTTSSPTSPSSMTEVNTRQSPLKPNTLNYMSVTTSGNIPFKFMKIMRHI